MNRKYRIKKTFFVVFFVTLFVTLFVSLQTNAATTEKEQIKLAVEKQLTGSAMVQKIYYLDYDKNGRKEAFILSGKLVKDDYGDADNTLWFGYCANGKVHLKKIKKNIRISAHTLNLKSATFFCAGRYCTTSYPENIYRVKDNRVTSIFTGDSIKALQGDSFTSVSSEYDACMDSNGMQTGHTWKPYYFYYKDGKVYEYKAKQISKSSFKKKYSNATKLLKKYKKMGSVIGIYVRSNGKVHINYRKNESDMYYFTNITFTISGKKLVKPVQDQGTYRDKLY